jgi:hypothetical protein
MCMHELWAMRLLCSASPNDVYPHQSIRPHPLHRAAATLQVYEKIKTALSFGKHANTDVSLQGLMKAARRDALAIKERYELLNTAECESRRVTRPRNYTSVTGFMTEIESLGHAPLPQQPEELTVTLYEHQK